MIENSTVKKGEIFNISFDNKKTIVGWLLFLTGEEEYLIRQNSGLIGFGKFKVKRKVYKSNIEFKDKIISKKAMKERQKKKSDRTYIGISIGVILSALLRNNIDESLIFGKINFPFSIGIGLMNFIIFWFFFVGVFFLVSQYRKIIFMSKLKNYFNGRIIIEGKSYEVNVSKKRINIIKYFIPFIFILGLITFLIIILPFLIQLRLFLVLIVLIALLLFYTGNIVIGHKMSEYIIIRMKK